VRFEIVQRFAASPDAVAAAYANPDFYKTLDGLQKLSRPEVLSHEVDGDRVTLRLRYQFIGDLSSAVRAVVDPRKLSWVEVSVHDLATRTATFRMDADHYADRFRCAGSYTFEDSATGGTTRRARGDLSVRARLVGHRVERAIVSGLEEHLGQEVPFAERWVAEHNG
jgi:hypothetical protein